MLSGPGAITTTIVLAGQAPGFSGLLLIVAAIFILSIIAFVSLAEARVIEQFLGETGTRVVERIMGLIVLVVGVQFIINGVDNLVLEWIG